MDAEILSFQGSFVKFGLTVEIWVAVLPPDCGIHV